MRRGWLICSIGWILPFLGCCLRLDVELDSPDTGFFLKPLFHGDEIFSLNDAEKHFVVTQPVRATSIRATYGTTFSARRQVSPRLLHASWANRSSLINNIVVGHLDISAHLVTRTIVQERPLLQVLFHASPLRRVTDTDDEERRERERERQQDDSKWCLQMHVVKAEQEVTSVCVLSGLDNVCVAELTIPADWWVHGQSASVGVYYSVYGIDQNLQCSSSGFTTSSSDDGDGDGHGGGDGGGKTERIKNFVSTVSLTYGQMTYQELKEDQHVLIYMPQKSFYPGSKFRVPVKLQAESDLQLFGIKVKTRHGIRILGAEPNDATKWRLTADINHKQHAGMVTAFVHNRDSYSKTDRIQDIFEFIFEVEAAATGENPGRISLTLEYESSTQQQGGRPGGGGMVENRVKTRVEIQHDNTYTIVPVIKTTEILNTAMLTGRIQNFSMRIYSISQTGKIGDITSHTTCHSGDDQVLKVAQSCNLVYVDGSESRGSASVSVIAKYGRHTKFLFFRVWVPEIPLEIELSDSKLSNIKGWKAPTVPSSPDRTSDSMTSRKTRGVDFGILTHPDLLLQEDGLRKEDYTTTCRLRYQTAVVEVYARFYVPDGLRHLYLVHRKALFRVSPLVKDHLRVADESIASINGLVVEGLKDGWTEVQVVSRNGRAIGAKELKVGNDKVTIERLQIKVISALDVVIEEEPEMPGTLVARINTQSKLQKNYQEGILDVRLQFSDGTTLPLEYVSPSDYFLDTSTLNTHVVACGPMLSASTPRVIALGQGQGELLKVALELGNACQRKRSRPLAVAYVFIDAEFHDDAENPVDNSGKKEKLLNDQSNVYGASTRYGNEQKSDDFNDRDEKQKADRGEKPRVEVAEVASVEAQQQPVVSVQPLSPLEIGMYVLLAVFCLAILIFMVNCVVFVVRYRRKRLPHDTAGSFIAGLTSGAGRRDPVANASDWVWIGRATLERNAISTTCQHTLMPDADFNGNHSSEASVAAAAAAPVPSTSSAPSSNRSSAAGSSSSSGSGSSGGVTEPLTGSLGSHRHSAVSTYKGSECSIRITSNPVAIATASPCATVPRLQPPRALPLRASVPEQRALLAARQLDVANGNLTDPGSDVEWDYEAMGLTYEQLMEYFDNLKESTA